MASRHIEAAVQARIRGFVGPGIQFAHSSGRPIAGVFANASWYHAQMKPSSVIGRLLFVVLALAVGTGTAVAEDRIVFASKRVPYGALFTMDADGSAQTVLIDLAYDDVDPAPSPDSERIAYLGHLPGAQDL